MKPVLKRSILMGSLALAFTSLALMTQEADARGGVHASARVSVHGGGGRPPARPAAGRPPAG
ncbi:hypothetical protein, partial [Thiocystis violacea]|uniref:hypothetical protein n=1 Tax=Thiocystis violacea TaxID=13725 RepID=UPI0019055447